MREDIELRRDGMQETRQKIAQAFLGSFERRALTTESQSARTQPSRDTRRLPASVPADGGRRAYDDDRRSARIRVDVDETIQAHVEAALLAGLADGGGRSTVRHGRRSRPETPTSRSRGSIDRRTSTIRPDNDRMMVPTAIFGSM